MLSTWHALVFTRDSIAHDVLRLMVVLDGQLVTLESVRRMFVSVWNLNLHLLEDFEYTIDYGGRVAPLVIPMNVHLQKVYKVCILLYRRCPLFAPAFMDFKIYSYSYPSNPSPSQKLSSTQRYGHTVQMAHVKQCVVHMWPRVRLRRNPVIHSADTHAHVPHAVNKCNCKTNFSKWTRIHDS